MSKRGNFMTNVQSVNAGEIPNIAAQVVTLCILGQIHSMKNGRQPNKRGGTRKSDAALRYCQDFALQVPPEARIGMGSRKCLLRAIVSVYYPSWRQDVDVEIVWDLLQKCGVVSNDRWIRQKFVYGDAIDEKNPRIEIQLEEI